MLTGEIRNQVDAIWNAFWTGGISNPLEVIKQITYIVVSLPTSAGKPALQNCASFGVWRLAGG
jgi:hypothetical protein